MKRPRKCDIDKCVDRVLKEKSPVFFTYHDVPATSFPNSDWLELPLCGLLGGALNTVNGFVGQKGRWRQFQLHLRMHRMFTAYSAAINTMTALVVYRKPGCGAAYTDLFYEGGQLHNPLFKDQFEILYHEHIVVPFTAYPNEWVEAPTGTFTVADYRTFPFDADTGVNHLELSLDLPFDVDRSTGQIDDGEIVLLLKANNECTYAYQSLLEYVCLE